MKKLFTITAPYRVLSKAGDPPTRTDEFISKEVVVKMVEEIKKELASANSAIGNAEDDAEVTVFAEESLQSIENIIKKAEEA